MSDQSITDNQCIYNRAGSFLMLVTSFTLVFMLGGCATTQENVWVNKDYSGKVSELYVRIDGAAVIPHKMSLSARVPKITPEFKAAMTNGSRSALQKMRTVAPSCIAGGLGAHGVSVKDEKEQPAARLILTPLRIESHSSKYGVTHKLWYMVILTDNTTKKQIWKGEFRMLTAPDNNHPDGVYQKQLDVFCGGIAENLASAGLLPR